MKQRPNFPNVVLLKKPSIGASLAIESKPAAIQSKSIQFALNSVKRLPVVDVVSPMVPFSVIKISVGPNKGGYPVCTDEGDANAAKSVS